MGHWIEIRPTEVPDRPRTIDEIFARSVDGVTVASVFSPAECARAVEVFESRRATAIPALFGRMLGLPLAELAVRVPDPNDRSRYFEDAEANYHGLVDAFGFDPGERVAGTLEALSGGRRVSTPSEAGRNYATGNLRWFESGVGGLPAHVDNEFEAYTDGSMSHLESLARIDGHLSWFVVLQAPTSGGCLSVYDQLYREHVPAQPVWNERGRDDTDFDLLPAQRISPSVGSMVVFGGGWRWHRIDDVGPGSDRITFGGFAADGRDGRDLFVWF